MGDVTTRRSTTTSQTEQYDQRQFSEGSGTLIGPGSQMVYPTSVSVFGSPDSNVGDITFITNAPAQAGLSDQLSGIMSPVAPTTPGTVTKAAKPNFTLYAAMAVVGFLVWRKMK